MTVKQRIERTMISETGEQVELPRYKCHKEVWALKIRTIEGLLGRIEPHEEGYAPFKPKDPNYFTKHNPTPGGYYVRYKDGYESFSPAAAFEDGYRRTI